MVDSIPFSSLGARVLIAATVCLLFAGVPSCADVVISSKATQNISCSGGTCSPTAEKAVLNVGDLETLLASENVKVTTTGSGVQASGIKLDATLSWSATNALALDAYESISIRASVTVTGLGGLTVTTNDGGSGGTFTFGPKGKVTFQNLASPLTIDGVSFTLVSSLPALAAATNENPSGAYALANNYNAAQDGTYNACPIDVLDGTIEGLGNTISRLSIEVSQGDAAMVQLVGSTGAIEHVRLARIDVKGSGSADNVAAGLVEENNGYLFGDSATGKVVASGNEEIAGGLVAANSSSGNIISSVANVNVTALNNGAAAGGLVFWNDGAIAMSQAHGKVSAVAPGGLVAANEGVISQDFATGAVEGGYPGGLVSANESNGTDTGSIENSYSTGSVSGGSGYVGGFVQLQDSSGYISYSYSTGAVGSGDGGFGCTGSTSLVSDAYWDTTTSGASYGWCGDLNVKGTTGLTTKQLQKKLPHGFSRKVWAQNPKINNGFPYLIANPPMKE